MVERKYTPGPWTFTNHLEGCNVSVGLKSGKFDLARIYTATPERVGNARLIAAAPEMLEALEAIYAGVVSGEGERVNLNVSLGAFKALESALAKATGGKP